MYLPSSMTESNDGQLQSRKNNSRAQSQTSRPSSPQPRLTHLHSGVYLDDQSHYYNQDAHAATEDVEGAEETSSEELDASEKETGEEGPDQDIIPEAQDGIEDQRDLEAGPQLEKRKSTRSIRDPNLVSWDGPDDPDNPKNWLLSRKWAATLIGK